MKNFLPIVTFTLFLLGIIVPALPAVAQNAEVHSRHGQWTVYTFEENGQTVCYMASPPNSDSGNYSKRGEISAQITHWPGAETKNVFSYVAGYPYKKGSTVSVEIGGRTFTLFTQGEMAWSPDAQTDASLIEAIKKGREMVVKGTSARGTLTTDTYSLSGSTAAHNAISKLCNVN